MSNQIISRNLKHPEIFHYDYLSFVNDFYNTYQHIHQSYKPLITAIILDDFYNPVMDSILSDSSKLSQLHKISGEGTQIFYFERTPVHTGLWPRSTDNRLSYLHEVNLKDKEAEEASIEFINRLLINDHDISLPGFMFFFMIDNYITEFYFIKFNTRDDEKIFSNIIKYIAGVNNVAKNIKYFDNQKEIFALVEQELRKQSDLICVQKFTKNGFDFIKYPATLYTLYRILELISSLV